MRAGVVATNIFADDTAAGFTLSRIFQLSLLGDRNTLPAQSLFIAEEGHQFSVLRKELNEQTVIDAAAMLNPIHVQIDRFCAGGNGKSPALG